jgi:hypothetical protein
VVGNADLLRHLAVEVRERARDRGTEVALVPIDEPFEELGCATRRSVTGCRAVVPAEDADAEAAGARIARALAVREPSETRIVGGSSETDAKALMVIPHGRPSSQLVTITTPLASALIASV